MIRRLALALTIAAVIIAVVVPPDQATAAPTAAGPSITLVSQTSWVPSDGTFEARVALAGAPADGALQLVLHHRVRTRTDLTRTFAGDQLPGVLYNASPIPLATAAPDPTNGSIGITLPVRTTTAGDPARVRLTAPGVYPVELQLQDVTGTVLDSLITYLALLPVDIKNTPPLAVAIVLDVGAPPALQANGSVEPDAIDRVALNDELGALAAEPDVPFTLNAVPETLDSLSASADPADAELVDRVRASLRGRAVANHAYVRVQPEALADAGFADELANQLTRGRNILGDLLQTTVSEGVWLADPSLGSDGMSALANHGIRHLVLDPSELTGSGPSTTLAQPFRIRGAPTGVDAVQVDTALGLRLRGAGDPVLAAQQILAELAVIWAEQPAVSRGVVMRTGEGTPDPTTLRTVLAGLRSGSIVSPKTLGGLFRSATPLLDRSKAPVVRGIAPKPATPLNDITEDLRAARKLLASFRSLIGSGSPRADPFENLLLLATGSDVARSDRSGAIRTVVKSVQSAAAGIDIPRRFTITLTARDGTIPLTLRNTVGYPLQVRVVLDSDKLEFPGGSTLDLELSAETTRIDLLVRTRASGAFPLDIVVTSPDRSLTIATARYTVRSTAVSGVGIVLSLGAGLFLLVWWASHWRRTRRSRRLVDPS